MFDIGTSAGSRRTPDLPLYTLRNRLDPSQIVQTTDPGRAAVTGRWSDMNRFKVPSLRGLAARAHGEHRYVFQIFALDVVARFESPPGRSQLLDKIRGHVIAKGLLIGTYERS